MADLGSALLTIPEATDASRGITRGLQLKDMVTQQQMNQLQLSQAQRADKESTDERNLLKGLDFSNPEDWAKGSQRLSKAGYPELAVKLEAQRQNIVSGKAEADTAKLKLESAKLDLTGQFMDAMGSGAASILQTMDGAQDPAQGFAQAKGMLPSAVKQVLDTLPADQPWAQQARQQITAFLSNEQAQSDPKKFRDILMQEIQMSQQGRAQLTQRQAELDKQRGLNVEERGEKNTERHDRAIEKIATTKAASGAFSDDQKDLLAELAAQGVSLPAGLRSQQQIKATLDGLLERSKGKSPAEIAAGIKSGKLQLVAETAGSRVAGNQIGKVALASNEIDTFGDQVLAASKNVPRGTDLTLNGILQAGEKELSNPALLTLKLKLQALNNAYEQLSSRAGIDKDKRDYIHSLFDQRYSDKAVHTLVTALKQEAVGARTAADRTIAQTSSASIPGTGEAPSAPGTGAAAAAPAATGTAPAGTGAAPAAQSQSKVVQWSDLP